MSDKHILCVECRGIFTDEEIEDATSCPRCGTVGIPADLRQTLGLKITRHELRILTIWAANYAHQIAKSGSTNNAKECIQGIINGIRSQHPDVGPLSLHEEFQEVADAFGSRVETSIWDNFDPKPRH